MTTTARFFLIGMITFFSVTVAFAQAGKQDVLYLKNGSIIRGTIIEFIPDKTVKIQTADSSLFVFSSLDVEKILKEETPGTIQKESVPTSRQKDNSIVASIFGGVALPGSDFADAADAGFIVGFQLHAKKKIGFLINFSYSSNPSPLDENWSSYVFLIGLKASIETKEMLDMYIAPVLGLYIQRIPVIDITGSGFAYGGMIGVQINDRIGCGIRYVAASPKYDTQGLTGEISTSMLYIFCSVTL